MKRIKTKNTLEIRINEKTEVIDNQIETHFEKKVTRFGTGAKIDCPKEHIGKNAYIIIRKK